VEYFGERLRRLRTATGLTASSLARSVGVTEGAIRQMESGQTKSASFSVGLAIADALGVDPWLLAFGTAHASGRATTSTPSLDARVARLEDRMKLVERTIASGKEAHEGRRAR
jgi:transcriptional regulator with XRE-family HTH domain